MLNVSKCAVTDDGLAHLEKMTTLGVLALNGTKVTNAGLVHLKTLPDLRVLNLIDCDVDDQGLEHLYGLEELRMLYVGGTKVTEEGQEKVQGGRTEPGDLRGLASPRHPRRTEFIPFDSALEPVPLSQPPLQPPGCPLMTDPHDREPDDDSPHAHLGLWDAVSIIVGIVVGTAIFKTPQYVFANVHGPWLGLGCWLLGGVLALLGSLCYAELATTYPRMGGDYVYLTRAFGRWVGFLFGWAQLTVILTGSIGAMAYAFGDYAVELFGWDAQAFRLVGRGVGRRADDPERDRRRVWQDRAEPADGGQGGGVGRHCRCGLRLGRRCFLGQPASRWPAPVSAWRWSSCCTPMAAGTTPPSWPPKSGIAIAICPWH